MSKSSNSSSDGKKPPAKKAAKPPVGKASKAPVKKATAPAKKPPVKPVKKAAAATAAKRYTNSKGARPARKITARTLFARIFVSILAFCALMALGGAAAAFYIYQSTELPTAENTIVNTANTVVYYSDGTTEMGRFKTIDRDPVPYDQMPKVIQQAYIAAEDRSFYENRGVSIRGIMRAAWNNLKGNPRQGASTITQQYVRGRFLDNEDKSYKRKMTEVILAMKVDREMEKEKIMENYLNLAFMGRGASGIQAGAQAHFGVDAKDLTPAQAIYLVSITPNPVRYDPVMREDAPAAKQARAMEKATARFDKIVLDMQEVGFITEAEAAQIKMPQLMQRRPDKTFAGPNGHLLKAVEREMTLGNRSKPGSAAPFTEEQFKGSGFRVVTTVDKRLQDAAIEIMNDTKVYPTRGRPKTVHAGLVALDPKSGGIRAMYGGSDYLKRQLNTAMQEKIQAGSTMKPITLAAGLEKGYGLRSTYNGDSGRVFSDSPNPVKNYGDHDYGLVDMMESTQKSINTPYVELNEKIKPQTTVDVAVRLGLPKDLTEAPKKGVAELGPTQNNVLGSASPMLIDMAHVYATFAAQGEKHTPHIVQEVKNSAGKTVFTGDTSGERVFDKAVMADVTYALQRVVTSGTASKHGRIGRPAAGKTGTSTDNRSAVFVGYTPSLVTAVGLHNAGPKGQQLVVPKFGAGNTGGGQPTKMWAAFMRKAMEGTEKEKFPKPKFVGKSKKVSAPKPTATESPTDGEGSTDGPTGQPTSTPTATRKPNPTRTTPVETPKPGNDPTRPKPTKTKPVKPQPTTTLPGGNRPRPEPTLIPFPGFPTGPSDR